MVESAPRRVAFTYISRNAWAGGYNYQLNLFNALARHCPDVITPVLFAGTGETAADLAPFFRISGVEVVQCRAFDRRYAGLLGALTIGIDRHAAEAFKDRNIDVVFENARFFGWRLPIPALAWLPDFQHARLPELFSLAARWRRDLGFRVQISSGRTILLSSNSALIDFNEVYPGAVNAVYVARFATEPSPDLLGAELNAIREEYRLPMKYFYLPNQFWRHKNHQVAIDALAILKERGVEVVIAASGSTKEPRKSDYFDRLMRQVSDRGLGKNFRYLGLIPLTHVFALLRGAMALINPSRFEGWSTTVEEAKSFDVLMILSDLAVHREQAGTKALYFAANDPNTLADYLAQVWRMQEPLFARNLLPGLESRVATFATEFIDAVEGCVEQFGRRFR